MSGLPSLSTVALEPEGILFPAPERLAVRLDPNDGPDVDHGEIGEDSRGVWIRTHPLVLADEDPALDAAIRLYTRGQVEVAPDDELRLSSWQLAAKLIILGAHRRRILAATRKEVDG